MLNSCNNPHQQRRFRTSDWYVSTTVGRIAATFAPRVHVPLRLNCNNFIRISLVYDQIPAELTAFPPVWAVLRSKHQHVSMLMSARLLQEHFYHLKKNFIKNRAAMIWGSCLLSVKSDETYPSDFLRVQHDVFRFLFVSLFVSTRVYSHRKLRNPVNVWNEWMFCSDQLILCRQINIYTNNKAAGKHACSWRVRGQNLIY